MNDMAEAKERERGWFLRWVRNRFFTGLIFALPVLATVWGVSWIVRSIDENVLRVLPADWNPETYIGIGLPGAGLIIAFIGLFVLGVLTQNFIGNAVISAGERLLGRVPVVSNVYNTLKQIVTTVAEQKDRAFRDVCLIEYPRKGLWAIGFVTADLAGAPQKYLKKDYVCVFIPTTPNPTSGFLLFTKKAEIEILDMTPEEGAKMIISGGMVSSSADLKTLETAAQEAKITPMPSL